MSNRIGSGATTNSTPTKTTLIPLQAGLVGQNDLDAAIQGKLSIKGIKIETGGGLVADPGTYGSLTGSQWSLIAAQLKKLGHPVQGKEEAKTILDSFYPDAMAKATSFKDIYNVLASDFIPGVDGAYAGPTKTINLQDPAVIDTIIKGAYQSMLKRDPHADELDARRKEIQTLVMKGQTATKTGTHETTYSPAFSQAEADLAVKNKIEKGGAAVQTDLAQANSIGFGDFLGKLGK
jgi:hypothetical protein